MKAVKILKICKDLLEMMSFCDLKVQDYKYLDLYAEYIKARQNHEKYTAVIMELSERHNISESTVKRIIRRFEKEI